MRAGLRAGAGIWYNQFMGNRKRKRGKQKKTYFGRHFMKPFLWTFGLVTAAGIAGMAAYLWVIAPAAPAADRHFQLTKEVVERGQEAEESQIEEIKTANDRYADILNDPEYMVENNIYARDAASPDEVTFAFAGDILFDDHYAVMARVAQNGGDITKGIDPALIEEMKRADVMMLNNEFPYSDRGEPLEGKQFTFRAPVSAAGYLNTLGVDLVSLANNHAYDYGETAFLDTMTALADEGIVYVGAGRDLAEARRPVCYIINNIKVAVVSATQIERLDNPDTKGATDTAPGVFRCWNGDNLIETVRQAAADNDFVIAYIHWGTENEEATDWAQEEQAVALAEAGADLIIGGHTHCLQRIDVVNGVPVAYSLGNFWFNSKTLDTGMIEITLDENGLRDCRFVPCLQSDCRTTLLTGEEKERVLDHMRSISGGVQIDGDGYITW